MQVKTQELIRKLATMNTTLARVWSPECEVALESALLTPNAHSRQLGDDYKSLNGRQQSVIDCLRTVDAKFVAGSVANDEIFRLSDGAFKTF